MMEQEDVLVGLTELVTEAFQAVEEPSFEPSSALFGAMERHLRLASIRMYGENRTSPEDFIIARRAMMEISAETLNQLEQLQKTNEFDQVEAFKRALRILCPLWPIC